jgi:hypothetical protein
MLESKKIYYSLFCIHVFFLNLRFYSTFQNRCDSEKVNTLLIPKGVTAYYKSEVIVNPNDEAENVENVRSQ